MHSHNMLHEECCELPCVQVLLALYNMAHFGQAIYDDKYYIISV